MSEDKRKLREGILVSFEEGLMSSVADRKNYQKRLDDFIARQSALFGKASEIPFCWKCNGTEVLYQKLELPLITKNNRFKSVKLIAAACAECGEEYINEKEVRSIEEIIKLINSYCSKEDSDVETNVSDCDVCGHYSIDNIEFEVYLFSNNSKIISVTVQEDGCMNCNAVYYADEGDQLALEHLGCFYQEL